MNMNEVLASLAGKDVHPNDHVNRCQSSNDVIPTAIQIACALKVRDELIPALTHLENALHQKSRAFHSIIKTGRTHLMDAVPVRLGEEFAAFAYLLERASTSVLMESSRLHDLPLGGTAAGTGLNAHPQFAKKVIMRLKKETKLPLKETQDHIAAQSFPLPAVGVSSALREAALVLTKIANDIRWMGSGPVAGLNELHLPELQAGSSIMPGKVNPVIPESVIQVCARVLGSDTTVSLWCTQGSVFELNTCLPLIANELLTSISHLTNASRVFADKCIKGIKANQKGIKEKLDRNAMLVTALAPHIGYDKAAKIAKDAMKTGESILEVATRSTTMSKSRLKKILNPAKMV